MKFDLEVLTGFKHCLKLTMTFDKERISLSYLDLHMYTRISCDKAYRKKYSLRIRQYGSTQMALLITSVCHGVA